MSLTNENGRFATQPNPNYQNAPLDFMGDEQLAQALDGATHLATVCSFEGVKATSSSPLDVRSLFWRQSAAADPARARPKLEGRAIVLAANAIILDRAGFEPSSMGLLATDFDVGNLSLSDVRAAAQAFFGANSIGTTYSTASSTPEARRWRLFVPLAQPITPALWLRILRGFAQHLGKAGVTVDATAERATQLHFLPNVPMRITDKTGREIAMRNPITGEPVHFEHEFWGAMLFDPQTLTEAAAQALIELDELDAAAEVLRQQQAYEREQKQVAREALRQQQLAAGGDGLTVVERFNLTYCTAELMAEYGYVEDPHKPGHWRSPLQTSGTYATQLRDDGSWFSLSGSDKAAGLGTPQRSGVGGDCFDIFAYFTHGGDKKAAVKAAAQSLGMPPSVKATQADVSAFTGVPLPEGMLRGTHLANPLGTRGSSDLEFDYTGDGKGFTASRTNIEKALLAKDFCHRVAFDAFKCEVMVCEPGDTVWRPLRDTDVFNIAVCIERNGFKAVSSETIRDAIGATAERNTFDSAQQWLAGLAWDGVPRVDEFLARGFATEAGAYQRAISRYVWTALAGRIISPGVKADMAPVAVGAQGCRKSSAVSAMAPKQEFFSELDLQQDEPDLFRIMKGKLVLELGELAGMRRKEAEHLKRFIAATHNTWVEKWKSTATSYARRSVYFGTTNEESFLSDPTGSRRWLPFNAGITGCCDPDWIATNRDQLFAEGAHLYNAHGVLFEEAERLAKAIHGDFAATDPWDDILDAWASRPGFDGVTPGSRPITTSDALRLGLGLTTAQINRGVEMRAGASLLRLGFKRVQRRIEGRHRWVYVKPS